ncbi:MAG: hypothetical protein HY325_04170 [Chloroflexi bacterium]|nr:hypothetical protein [Chloroflexota bacterium]
MSTFLKLILGGVVGGVLLLGRPGVALAHDDDLHLTEGFVLTPLTIAIFGGTLAGIFLTGFLLWRWASRSLKRKEERERRLRSSGSKAMIAESHDIREEG